MAGRREHDPFRHLGEDHLPPGAREIRGGHTGHRRGHRSGRGIDYLTALGLDRIAAHEHDLLVYATERLTAIPGLRILGNARDKASVISFVVAGIHPHDLGSLLDGEGVVVRAGHHCAQPVMARFNVPATTRASFAYFNTREEVDVLVSAVIKAIELFK